MPPMLCLSLIVRFIFWSDCAYMTIEKGAISNPTLNRTIVVTGINSCVTAFTIDFQSKSYTFIIQYNFIFRTVLFQFLLLSATIWKPNAADYILYWPSLLQVKLILVSLKSSLLLAQKLCFSLLQRVNWCSRWTYERENLKLKLQVNLKIIQCLLSEIVILQSVRSSLLLYLGQVIYWGYESGGIETANMDGSLRMTIYQDDAAAYTGLALDASYLYIADSNKRFKYYISSDCLGRLEVNINNGS